VTEQAQVTEEVRKEQIELEGADAVYPSTGGGEVRQETETHTELDVEPRK
jgi:hypothetical protein